MTDEMIYDEGLGGADAKGEVWRAFWDALLVEPDPDELDRLLTAHPRAARELPWLAELIWETVDPDLSSSERGKTLLRLTEVLLRHGSDLEARRHEGMAPLMLAAKRGNVAMVEFLIRLGSVLEARDDFGQNVLHMAADGRDLLMMKPCLEAGLDPNLADDGGRTPLHVLCDGSYDSCPDLVALLLSRGASPNARDHQRRTVLHLLARERHYEVKPLRLLVAAGADPFCMAEEESTPWSIASGNEDETFRAVVREAAHAGDFGALAIFEAEALDLIRRGQAGYYSFFASRNCPHQERLCVFAEGQWFLLPTSVATLVRAEPAPTSPDDEFYLIQFTDASHPVAAMVGRERERFGPGPNFSREVAEFVARMLRFQNRLRGVGGGLA